jgi:rubrerythrin
MGGGALLGALTPGAAMAAKGKGRPPAKFGKGDVGILNFALTLEYLEAAFYNEATANQRKSSFIKDGQTQVFLKTVTADENAHVAYLKKALGKKAVAAPKVDFGGTTSQEASFVKTALALENTGVHAYSGQALNIKTPATVGAALSILTVEARHASVIGLIAKNSKKGISPDGPFDTPFTANEVLKAVEATGFLK